MTTTDEKTGKRGKYVTKKRKELEDLLLAAKEFQFNEKKEKETLCSNPQSIAEFTKNSCLYPARYLDNDDTCVTCDIYEHCACRIKNLGKRRRNE